MKKIISLIIVIILSLGIIRALFLPGYFPMHDDTQPSRIYEMSQALRQGQFPVRWVPDLGYGFGYPLFNFYAPLPYYVGSVFNLFGIDAITSAKIMFAVGAVLAGISMFLLISELFGTLPAITAAVLYMYAPYHAVNIFVRGAVGEYYAYAFLPFLLLGVIKIFRSQFKSGLVIGSLSYAAILLSHNILGMITTYFLIVSLILYLIYIAIKKQNKFIIYNLAFIILLGFSLSAFFTLPAFLEKSYTKVDTLAQGSNHYSLHFVYPFQLWNSPWGFAGSTEGTLDGMSFMVGKIHFILAIGIIFAILFIYKKKIHDRFQFLVISFGFLIFLVSLFFTLGYSKIFYDLLPGFAFIQYPWRFLNFAVFSVSIISSVYFILIKNKALQIIFSALVIILTIYFNWNFFYPQGIYTPKESDFISSDNLRFRISKISDEYMPPDFPIPKELNQTVSHGISSTSELNLLRIDKEAPNYKKYEIVSGIWQQNVLNIAYFPGWQAYVDGRQVTLGRQEGKISVAIPDGRHILELKFKETRGRLLANTISLLSLFLLVYFSLFRSMHFLWPKKQSR